MLGLPSLLFFPFKNRCPWCLQGNLKIPWHATRCECNHTHTWWYFMGPLNCVKLCELCSASPALSQSLTCCDACAYKSVIPSPPPVRIVSAIWQGHLFRQGRKLGRVPDNFIYKLFLLFLSYNGDQRPPEGGVPETNAYKAYTFSRPGFLYIIPSNAMF